MDFNNHFEVAKCLKADLGYTDYGFLNTDIPFPSDEESYQHFIHSLQFIDAGIMDYERKRKE